MNELNKHIVGYSGAALAGLVAGGTIGYLAGKTKRKYKSSARKYARRKKKVHNNSRTRKQRKPYTAGKRRDTSHRRIRYTKNNQPYIILASGKARFIKRSSVRNRRNRKGGTY